MTKETRELLKKKLGECTPDELCMIHEMMLHDIILCSPFPDELNEEDMWKRRSQLLKDIMRED